MNQYDLPEEDKNTFISEQLNAYRIGILRAKTEIIKFEKMKKWDDFKDVPKAQLGLGEKIAEQEMSIKEAKLAIDCCIAAQ